MYRLDAHQTSQNKMTCAHCSTRPAILTIERMGRVYHLCLECYDSIMAWEHRFGCKVGEVQNTELNKGQKLDWPGSPGTLMKWPPIGGRVAPKPSLEQIEEWVWFDFEK